ncbi:MAG TPA: type IV pilin, partial [Thermoplasmata archaeon]|nr:type IV pilin [Thermoplasmata archaeon]
MIASEASGRRIRPTRFHRSSFRRSGRGVSDVIATILLLALCVTLFASVFFFVNTFPRPPSQPANQFSATLTYKGAAITAVNVLHLAGPTIAGVSLTQTSVYLSSAAQPHVFGAPFTLASGLNGSTVWSLGQTWSLNITSYGLTVPDNITISIISNAQLLFRITLPGSNPNTPPIFTQA